MSTKNVTNFPNPGTAGNVPTSNGSTWTSASPSASDPIGTLSYFATAGGGSYLGSNWLLCDGSTYSQSTYTTLFSRLGLLGGGGTSWTYRPTQFNANISVLSYGAVFLAGSTLGTIYTSTDAVTWSARASLTASSITSFTYGNSLYVYGGYTGALGSSTDGTTWTQRTSGTSSSILALAYGNSTYVYSGAFGLVATSTDVSVGQQEIL